MIDFGNLEAELEDPRWRMRNLYQCRQEGKGNAIPFVPRAEQEEVIAHLEETPEVPVYIIKSRRLGMSTTLGTYQVDKAYFESGWRSILIDQKQEDATKKMVEIIRFAIDNMDPLFLEPVVFDKRNDGEMRFRVTGETESEDSVIFAGTGGRGGDCNLLHVSEWGPIAAKDAKRSREIRTGAFPAARMGRRIVETTWMGGKGGDLWELVEPILEGDPNSEGRIFFFPWHGDPAAVKFTGALTGEAEQYFKELGDRLGKTFSREQKLWWIAKKLEQGIFMSREYPSTLDEAFSAPVEGAIYAGQMDRARAEGRIREFPWDRSHPVHTLWDLGAPLNTRTIYFQMVGREIHVIDYDAELDHDPTARVAWLKGKGYPLGSHFLPHDARAKEKSGDNFQQQLEKAGLANIEIVPRCANVVPGINKTRELIPRMLFHAKKCARLIDALDAYRWKVSPIDGRFTDDPVHDWSSHGCDALRQLAEAMDAGLLKNGPQPAAPRVISPIRGLGDAPRRVFSLADLEDDD